MINNAVERANSYQKLHKLTSKFNAITNDCIILYNLNIKNRYEILKNKKKFH